MRRLKILLLAVVFPLALLGAGGMWFLRARHKPKPIRTAKVTRGEVEITVRETGTVQPVKSVDVKSKAAGLIEELAVEEGDEVAEGQLIARLDVPELEAQRDQTRAQLDGATARVNQARLAYGRDRKLISAQLTQAEASLRAARAALTEAESRRRDAERIARDARRLFEMGGFVSENEVASAEAAAKQSAQQARAARERVTEQKAAVEIARARQSEIALSKSRLAEAEASLRQIQDSLAEIESRLGDAVIRAPCSGTVIARHVREGELITAVSYYGAGAPIVTIGDLSTMLVKVNLNEVDIAKVHLGQSVKITADALRDRTFHGRVSRISPASVGETSNDGLVKFPVEVTIIGDTTGLKPGMTANIEISCEKAEEALWVPNDALFEKKGKHFVTVVTGRRQGKPLTEDREVTIGLSNDSRTEIRSGLSEGEEIQLGRADIPDRKKIDIGGGRGEKE